ncbi:MAG: lipoate--protein ligase [Deltaproteobacteria bacterium]|jgi:lipoate-protein ligase A|nr:lipoate--protein ligase [Deltaproteobacteria bacterium]
MILVDNPSRDPSWNLALEERLFQRAGLTGRGHAMLWRNGPSVIVGRFQNAFEELDPQAAQAAGVKVVRRSTGGGAVYHDLGNLNYTLAVPHDNVERIDFKTLAVPVVEILRELGVPAELSGRNDLTVSGLKFSGTAQMVSQNSLLYHGTLMYDVDLTRLSTILRVAPEKYLSKGAKSIRSRVTNLKEWLPPDIDLDVIESRLAERLGPEKVQPSEEDMAAAREIQAAKYGNWEWNWGRSPESTVTMDRRFPWGWINLRFQVVDGLVAMAKVYGDFFGGDLGEAEKALLGLPFEGDELTRRVGDLANAIDGASPGDLIGLLRE